MSDEILYHYYPWSLYSSEESCVLNGTFPFFGFPTFSSSPDVKDIIVTSPFEVSFWGSSGLSRQFFSLPISIGSKGTTVLSWSGPTKRNSSLGRFLNLEAQYRKEADGGVFNSDVLDIVQNWLAFFDELIDWCESDQIASDKVLEFLLHLSDRPQEPRLDLVVQIAEKMHGTVIDIIFSPRRVLSHYRDMVPIGKIDEIDSHCLQWFVKQPGEDFIEKGGVKQELMGIVRSPSTNTLENRIFRDFIKLCEQRARQYQVSSRRFLHGERSQRVINVGRFRKICEDGLDMEYFASLPSSSAGVQPNYVLQADARYAPVWRWYRKLLYQEKAKDFAWNWQFNTWCDIGCLLLSLSISQIRSKERAYKSLLSSKIQFLDDQDRGCRMIGSSLPGPFVLEENNNINKILELVHYKDVMDHNDCARMASLGGHLYLVNHQVNKPKPFEYVVCWFLDTVVVASNKPSVEEIALSAKSALDNIPGMKMSGIIVLSTVENTHVDKFFNDQVQVVSLNVDCFNWHNVVMEYFPKVIADALWR